jgi:hypothetical protein
MEPGGGGRLYLLPLLGGSGVCTGPDFQFAFLSIAIEQKRKVKPRKSAELLGCRLDQLSSLRYLEAYPTNSQPVDERNKPQPISHGRSAKSPANLLITTPIADSNNVANNRNSSTRCAGRKFMTKPHDHEVLAEQPNREYLQQDDQKQAQHNKQREASRVHGDARRCMAHSYDAKLRRFSHLTSAQLSIPPPRCEPPRLPIASV